MTIYGFKVSQLMDVSREFCGRFRHNRENVFFLLNCFQVNLKHLTERFS